MSPLKEDKYDLNRIIIRPLYFGMVVNILIPMGLLLVCYYFETQQSWYNRIGQSANTLFYIFAAVAVVQAGVAVWWRSKIVNWPMIRSKETFEDDLVRSLSATTRPISIIIAGISLYGVIYFYLTARFKETLFLVVFSFVVFQVIRPRFGFIRKLIERQEAMVEKGEFLRD